MPRKKARQFEPRGGVSQSMLDAECRYIIHELEDYLLLSVTDLRQHLAERQTRIAHSEEALQQYLAPLADRERLALRCMIARDIAHMAALYETYFRSGEAPQTTAVSSPQPEERTEENEPQPVLPFQEWLFKQ